MNQHCGKHDKIFDEDRPCPGCESERGKDKEPVQEEGAKRGRTAKSEERAG
jgi:hypothetical protein